MEDTVPDTLKFIQQVRLRPQLWDPEAVEFTDKIKKKEAWLEVSRGCYSNFDELPLSSRREICTSLQKKWKNHRSCFAREVRKRKLRKRSEASGAPIDPHKTYIYFDELMFLNRHLPQSSGLRLLYEEGINAQTFTNLGDSDNRTSKERKEEIEDTPVARMCEVLEKCIKKWSSTEQENENNEDRLFALSVVKHFKNIPARSRLQARMEIMSVMSTNATIAHNDYVPYFATQPIFPSTLQQVTARALWAQQQERQEQPGDNNDNLQNDVSDDEIVEKPKPKRLCARKSMMNHGSHLKKLAQKEEEEKANWEADTACEKDLARIQNLNGPSSLEIESTVNQVEVKTELEEFDNLKNLANNEDRDDDPDYVHYEEVFIDIKPPTF